MRGHLRTCLVVMLLGLFAVGELRAQGKPFRRLTGTAPSGVPRILADNRTCLFVSGIFKNTPLVSLDLSTGRLNQFQRAAGMMAHPEESLHAPGVGFPANSPEAGKYPEARPILEVIDVSPDGKVALLRHHIASSTDRNPLRDYLGGVVRREVLGLWDVSTGKLLRVLERSEFDFTLAAWFLPDGKSLVVSCESYLPERFYRLQRKPIGGFDKATIEKASLPASEYRVDLYDVKSGTRSKELGTRQTQGRTVAVSSDGLRIAVAGGTSAKKKNEFSKPELVVIEVVTGKQVVLVDGPWSGGVFSGARTIDGAIFTSDGKLLGTSHGWWDVVSEKPVFKPWMGLFDRAPGVFSPDGRCYVVADEKAPLAIEVGTGRRLTGMGTLKVHKGLIVNLAFSPDTASLLTIGHDGEMILWNLKHETVAWPKENQ